jgi:hypothetical protein
MNKSITFFTPLNQKHKIIVTFDNETSKEYDEEKKDQYLVDYPDRANDLIAMGWLNKSLVGITK